MRKFVICACALVSAIPRFNSCSSANVTEDTNLIAFLKTLQLQRKERPASKHFDRNSRQASWLIVTENSSRGAPPFYHFPYAHRQFHHSPRLLYVVCCCEHQPSSAWAARRRVYMYVPCGQPWAAPECRRQGSLSVSPSPGRSGGERRVSSPA